MNERNLRDAKVGDPLILCRPMHRGPSEVSNVTVTKVAIKYLTVEWVYGNGYTTTADFRRDNGEERGSYSGSAYHRKVMTAECLELILRRDAACARVTPRLRSYAWERDLSTDQLERIADILEEK